MLAFYRFVRAADDVADHPTAARTQSWRLLEQMRASLVGDSDAVAEGVALRGVLAVQEMRPTHALDLLEAFRRDVTKLRYADWDELMDYCRYSAMPVGRFVLDVHGESRICGRPMTRYAPPCRSSTICRIAPRITEELNRVYIPARRHEDGRHRAVRRWLPPAASAALRNVIAGLAEQKCRHSGPV